jgi:hypothetical protein
VENEAASRIQRFFRDVCKLYKMRDVVHAMLQARTIQKMVRGMVTRKWLAPWFLKRAYLTVKWQASFRRWRSNKYWGMQEVKNTYRETTSLEPKMNPSTLTHPWPSPSVTNFRPLSAPALSCYSGDGGAGWVGRATAKRSGPSHAPSCRPCGGEWCLGHVLTRHGSTKQ